MWWPGSSATWHEAHVSLGATTAGRVWAVAEGQVGGATRDEDTYLLVANVSDVAGQAEVTLYFEDGTSAVRDVPDAAAEPPERARADGVPRGHRAPVRQRDTVAAGIGHRQRAPSIIVEQAMYWTLGSQVFAAGATCSRRGCSDGRLLLAGAAAGAMGWGIRGQYGHETGAMIAGLLVSLVIVQTVRPHAPASWAMRAAAFGTIGVGFGGAMTYGQTIGLTQDAALVGNWAALRWGLLGLSLKGAVWIGFLGACLGMGLGSVRYRARELCLLMLTLVGVAFVGMWLLNEPHDPAQRVLPRLYFSASWYWRPEVADLQPRREVWGGLLLALAALGGYAGAVRRDQLALRLLGWGLLGGAIGFPLGQCLQAFHAWNPEVFARGLWAGLDPHVNWWNAMETTFGAVMGAAVSAGVWLNRDLVAAAPSFAADADDDRHGRPPCAAGGVGRVARTGPARGVADDRRVHRRAGARALHRHPAR